MNWTRVTGQPYAMKSGQWTVAKIIVNGSPRYELWKDGQDKARGSFSTFSAAMAAAEAFNEV